MRKQYWWAMQEADGKKVIMRFSFEGERAVWIDCLGALGPGASNIKRYALGGTDPNVRRLKHMIKNNEAVTFPVAVD